MRPCSRRRFWRQLIVCASTLGQRPPRPATGTHLSRAIGASLDFRDFNPYTPGDDLRRVDWNVYQRTGGHLFIRRFDQPTQTRIHLVLDDSPSLFAEQDDVRVTAAARAAAAIVAAALNGDDAVRLSTSHVPALGGSSVTARRRLPEVLNALAQLQPRAAASLHRTLHDIVRSRSRGEVVVIISDFFDDRGSQALISDLKRIHQRLALVQVTRPSDADPTLLLAGDLELVDSEQGTAVKVSPDATAIAAYRATYAAYQDALVGFARQRAVPHILVDAEATPLRQLEPIFPNGVFRLARGWS